MARPAGPLDGLRILVVEDNFLVAEAFSQLLEVNGCTIVGPAGQLDEGLTLAGREALDGALLDINLAGDRSFPIARVLRGRGVPFMFVTGYDDISIVPHDLRSMRRLGKPVINQQLIAAMKEDFVPGP